MTSNIRLVRLLGHGGMGSVWIADHLGLHTQVVVKFVARELADNAEIRERFAREAALAAQAKSPHVVQILDHGMSELGLPYIAMELLEGEDLGLRILREGTIAPPLFADWLNQACKGLARIHAKGVIHRDIKPDNIFLSESDGETVVKVLDFGIAKGSGAGVLAGTQTGALVGTAYFMSPEQTMGAKDIDLRTDLWSLGITTYLALTGTRPFECESLGAIVHAITSDVIPPPSRLNPALGPAIDAWMAKALARPVDERFGSAKEMADAFTQAVHGFSPRPSALAFTAAPPRPVRFSTSVGVVSDTRPKSARTGPFAATLAAGLLTLGGFGYALWSTSRAPEPVALTSGAVAAPLASEIASEPPDASATAPASPDPDPVTTTTTTAPTITKVAHRPPIVAPTPKPVAPAPAPSATPNRLKMGLE